MQRFSNIFAQLRPPSQQPQQPPQPQPRPLPSVRKSPSTDTHAEDPLGSANVRIVRAQDIVVDTATASKRSLEEAQGGKVGGDVDNGVDWEEGEEADVEDGEIPASGVPSDTTPPPSAREALPRHSAAERPQLLSAASSRLPKNYVCNVCGLREAHFFQDCDNPHGCPPDPSYLCVLCKVPGHHVKWCPTRKPKRRRNSFYKQKPTSSSTSTSSSTTSAGPSTSTKRRRRSRSSKSADNPNLQPVGNNPRLRSAPIGESVDNRFVTPDSNRECNSDHSEAINTSTRSPPPNSAIYHPSNPISSSYDREYASLSESYAPSSHLSIVPESVPSSQKQENYPQALTNASPPAPPPPDSILAARNRLCRFYKTNKCTAGSSCRFSHDTSTEPCVFHHLRNACTSGAANCRFSHDPISSATKELLIREHQAFKERKHFERVLWEAKCSGAVPDAVLKDKFGMDFSSSSQSSDMAVSSSTEATPLPVSEKTPLTEEEAGPMWIRDLKMGDWASPKGMDESFCL